MNKSSEKGVTLVELIVSFAIVGVAIIYFFQTLYTVKKIYNDAFDETNKYVDKSYVVHFLNEYLSGKYIISSDKNASFENVCDKYKLNCEGFSLVKSGDGYLGTITGLTNGGYKIQNIHVTMLDGSDFVFPIKALTLNGNVNTHVLPIAYLPTKDSNGLETGFPSGIEGVKTNVVTVINGKSQENNVMQTSALFENIYNVNSGSSLKIDYDMTTDCPATPSSTFYNKLTNNTSISVINLDTGEEITNPACQKSLVNENISANNRWVNQDICEFQGLSGRYKIKVNVERNNNNSVNKGIRCGVYTAINSVKVSK